MPTEYGIFAAITRPAQHGSLDHVGPLARTVADTAILLQAIAGYDRQEINSRPIPVPDYAAALRLKTSSLRLVIQREFFFADLDPEIDVATKRIANSVADVQLPDSSASS